MSAWRRLLMNRCCVRHRWFSRDRPPRKSAPEADHEPVRPIVFRQRGGDGSAEVEALIGDKLLDVFLYRRLVDQYKCKPFRKAGKMAHIRDRLVSNKALAACGKEFLVPKYISEEHWDVASVHQKGTAVEALLGRMFLKKTFKETDIMDAASEVGKLALRILKASERSLREAAMIEAANAAVHAKAGNLAVKALVARGVNVSTSVAIYIATTSRPAAMAQDDRSVPNRKPK
ncbi:RNase III domain-containing protein [Plasmodiophora brassicae]